MTLGDLINQWGTATPSERFAFFEAWLIAENSNNNGATIDSTNLFTASAGETRLFIINFSNSIYNPRIQILVNRVLFEDSDSQMAIDVGLLILGESEYYSKMQQYYRDYEERKEWEKARKEWEKQRDKLYEKWLKSIKEKGKDKPKKEGDPSS